MRCEKRFPILVTWALIVGASSSPAADEAAAPAGAARAAVTPSPSPSPLADAKTVAALSPAEKKDLQGKQERFYRLDQKAQDQLRQLHGELTRCQDSERLQAVLTRYARWLQTLPSGQRADLLSLSPDERAAEIKHLLQQQTASRMRSYVSRKLSDEDLTAIAKWMEETVQRHEPEILERVPNLKEHLGNISDPKRRIQALVIMVHRSGFSRDWLQPTPEEIDRLKSGLSTEARQDLEKAKAAGQLPELAEAWMRAAMFSRLAGPPADKEQLRRFFKEELDSQQREYLEGLPPERMQAELVRMYDAHRFRRDGYRDWPGFRKPGSGFRGFPPRFGPPPMREPNGGERPKEKPNTGPAPPGSHHRPLGGEPHG
jgi:hypothetical protein